jgi:hypothetical protein
MLKAFGLAEFFDRPWRLATAPLRTSGRYRGVLISHTPEINGELRRDFSPSVDTRLFR